MGIVYASTEVQNAAYKQGFHLGQRLQLQGLTLNASLQHGGPIADTYLWPARGCFMNGVELGWFDAHGPFAPSHR